MPSAEALGWWALQFTPRVAWVDEALLLEVSACERLWGGRLGLLREIARLDPAPVAVRHAQGTTSLVALARLRLRMRGETPPADLPGGLPLHTLGAAREHLGVLANLGCRRWGDVAALPRGGLSRRFGRKLRDALDAAYGLRPEAYAWLTLPEHFDQKLELPALAESAPELMWSAQRLLSALHIWLAARQLGALALELQWTLDLRRLNGVTLPPHQHLVVRTAEPTQDMAHLRRLMAERLALTTLAAPASWLRLRSLEARPLAGISTSFLPEDNRPGDRLHQLVERLSARLGAAQVLRATPRPDARPECRQAWGPALDEAVNPGKSRATTRSAAPPSAAAQPEALYPTWLLREPLPLALRDGQPCHGGQPLRRLVGPQRLEAGWWIETPPGPTAGSGVTAVTAGGAPEAGRPAVRDYYIAERADGSLVWIYRERPSTFLPNRAPRWFLQGLYA